MTIKLPHVARCVCFRLHYYHYQSLHFIYICIENTAVLSPPPYPSHLPSYEEILRLPSPMQLQLYDEQVTKFQVAMFTVDSIGSWVFILNQQISLYR